MSLFSELAARRVPQILGLYVAGTWMAIEIGDWLIEKFALPDSLTRFIFIALAVMLPSIALVAWNHGAPGRDQWTRTEKAWIPCNLLAAAAALFVVGRAPAPQPPAPPAEPIKMMTVVDETGASQEFEVPVGQFHKRVSVFFLANELSSDDSGAPDEDAWLTYGLPVMVAHDLNHETPLVTASTPFDALSLKENLQERGFADLRGAPRALQVNLARQRNSSALVSGRLFRDADGALSVEARLIDAQIGTELFRESMPIDDPRSAADAISQLVQNALTLDPSGTQENDPVRDNYSASIEAIRLAVDALRIIELDNDYPTARARVEQAIALDNAFAEAYGSLGNIAFLNGDPAAAAAAMDSALKHDYKLSTSSRFLFKARRYIYTNDVSRGLEVLRLWSQIEPQNPKPLELLGRVLAITGQNHDEAISVMQAALDLNPLHAALLQSMAEVEQSRSNYADAAAYAQRFIDARPEDGMAHKLLADVYLAANDFERAEKAYLDAELLSADDLGVKLGLASLAIRQGRFEDAEARIDQAMARELTPQQRVQALNGRVELAYSGGRIQLMLDTLDTIDDEARKFLPPLLRVIQVGLSRISGRAALGDFAGAREEVARVDAELQAPFNGMLYVPSMSLEWIAGNRDEAVALLDDIETFARERADPSYDIVLEYARAFGAAHAQDAERTIKQVDTASRLMETSLLATAGSPMLTMELQVDMARLLYGVGALDEARNLLERVLQRAPFMATAHLLLAHIWLDLENVERARQALDTAMSIWINADERFIYFAEARELEARLAP